MWVVYDHPLDFPDSFVARKHIVVLGTDAMLIVTEEIELAPTLREIRKLLEPLGLVCLPRYENDDPKIIEVWL